MSNSVLTKGKHLTMEQRIFIERALDENYTLLEIAKRIEKDPTTISKEIKRNRIESKQKRLGGISTCNNRANCDMMHICNTSCKKLCKSCKIMNCYKICPQYALKKCSTLSRFPYVCNGCRNATP